MERVLSGEQPRFAGDRPAQYRVSPFANSGAGGCAREGKVCESRRHTWPTGLQKYQGAAAVFPGSCNPDGGGRRGCRGHIAFKNFRSEKGGGGRGPSQPATRLERTWRSGRGGRVRHAPGCVGSRIPLRSLAGQLGNTLPRMARLGGWPGGTNLLHQPGFSGAAPGGRPPQGRLLLCSAHLVVGSRRQRGVCKRLVVNVCQRNSAAPRLPSL